MKSSYRALSLASFLFSLTALTFSCASSDVGGGGGGAAGLAEGGSAGATPSTDTCSVDDDCTFGEIDHEITKPSECVCLYGCVYLPETKMTAARRLAQHDRLCKPDSDGDGNSCGIDDCAVPGAVACVAGTCKASNTTPDQ